MWSSLASISPFPDEVATWIHVTVQSTGINGA